MEAHLDVTPISQLAQQPNRYNSHGLALTIEIRYTISHGLWSTTHVSFGETTKTGLLFLDEPITKAQFYEDELFTTTQKEERMLEIQMDSFSQGEEDKASFEGADRISTLPDKLIHHIFSFVDTKHAVQCSILSKRWKHIWTSLPFVNLLSNQADTTRLKTFDFMTSFFIMRNYTSHLLSLYMQRRDYIMSVDLLSIIVRYAVSHNVEEINVHTSIPSGTNFPIYMFNSKTLRVLRITGFVCASTAKEANLSWYFPCLRELHVSHCISPKLYWHLPGLMKLCLSRCTQPESFINMPSLTCLHLDGVMIYRDNFCELVNLEKLRLVGCRTSLHVLNIICSGLKCLSIRYFRTRADMKLVISVPSLVSMYLHFGSLENLGLCRYVISPKLAALDDVKLDIYKFSNDSCDDTKALTTQLFSLLDEFRNAKSLTIDSNLVEILALALDALKKKPLPFKNLKFMKVLGQSSIDTSDIPSVVKDYLPTGCESTLNVNDLPEEDGNVALVSAQTAIQSICSVEDSPPLTIPRLEQGDFSTRVFSMGAEINSEEQDIIDSGGNVETRSVEEDEDRISSLPDVLVHHILSFIDVKYAVQASTLSKRWKNIWTTLPYVNILLGQFSSRIKAYDFLAGFFIMRSHHTEMLSFNFQFQSQRCACGVDLLGTIVRYAILHDVQVLNIHRCMSDQPSHNPFQICMFVSPYLRRLNIEGIRCAPSVRASWHLPSLTYLGIQYSHLPQSYICNLPNVVTLHLRDCVLPVSLLSMSSLTSLHLCKVRIETDTISELVNLQSLSLDSCSTSLELINVHCPGLKHLSISCGTYWSITKRVNIIAPSLSFFEYNSWSIEELLADRNYNFASNLTLLKEVKLDAYYCDIPTYGYRATDFVKFLDEFHNAISLVMGCKLIEVLSIALDTLKNERSSFKNLKFLKVQKGMRFKNRQKVPREINNFSIPNNVKTYLRNSSPNIIFINDF